MTFPAHILIKSVAVGVIRPTMTTGEVVRLLNDNRFNRNSLRSDEMIDLLGRKRYGNGRNYQFNTLKVLELKTKLDENKGE